MKKAALFNLKFKKVQKQTSHFLQVSPILLPKYLQSYITGHCVYKDVLVKNNRIEQTSS